MGSPMCLIYPLTCYAIAMNVIRMIKLFGWEKKVIGQVEEKREEELVYYKKRQFLGLVNMNIKYVQVLSKRDGY